MTQMQALADPAVLRDCELIFSGWGAPVLDERFLSLAPALQALFYGAGSVKYFVTEASWAKGVRIVSAWQQNALPVTEYVTAMVLLSLKQIPRDMRRSRAARAFVGWDDYRAGNFYSTVGLVSLGVIGRQVARALSRYDLQIIAYDPFAAPETARELGIRLCGLEELFAQADLVSLHTPLLPETAGMVNKKLLASMKPNACLLNSSRGKIIDGEDFIEVFRSRPDLTAVLDVTDPEPPAAGSPLWQMENVFISPHLAGSLGRECRRHAFAMADECGRYLRGEPLRYEITREMERTMA